MRALLILVLLASCDVGDLGAPPLLSEDACRQKGGTVVELPDNQWRCDYETRDTIISSARVSNGADGGAHD